MKIAIIGAGIAGLCTAYHLLRYNHQIYIFDHANCAVTDVAAGMITPASELFPSESNWATSFREAAKFHKNFIDELCAHPKELISQTEMQSLCIATSRDGEIALARWKNQMQEMNFIFEDLSPDEWLQLRVSKTNSHRRATKISGEYAIDPRRLRNFLREFLQKSSQVQFRSANCISIEEAEKISVITDDKKQKRDFDAAVVATGMGRIKLPVPLPLRAVKGQIVTLQGPQNFLKQPVRIWDRFQVYLVPRHDGKLVIGATCEEREDAVVTAGGVMELLFAAWNAFPEISEFPVVSFDCGLRPATPDNMPILGEISPDSKIFVVAGLYRHGILLAPFLSDHLAKKISGKSSELNWEMFSAQRFMKNEPQSLREVAS